MAEANSESGSASLLFPPQPFAGLVLAAAAAALAGLQYLNRQGFLETADRLDAELGSRDIRVLEIEARVSTLADEVRAVHA